MINDLFELARLDAGALQLDRQPVDLAEIAAEVIDAMQARARQHGVALILAAPSTPLLLPLDGARIEREIADLAPRRRWNTTRTAAVGKCGAAKPG